MLRPIVGISLAALLLVASVPSFASSEDDNDWIAKCMQDNKKEGQEVETVMIYCHCMDEQMSESEDRSITEWEKTHPGTEAACAKKAGWE